MQNADAAMPTLGLRAQRSGVGGTGGSWAASESCTGCKRATGRLGSWSGHVVVRLGAGHGPPSQGFRDRPLPAWAAKEEAIREGFLEKASTQRPTGGRGVRLGR